MVKLEVQLRDGFSDRNSIKKENTIIQYDVLDKRTRFKIIQLVNYFFSHIYDDVYSIEYSNELERIEDTFVKKILINLYCTKVDFESINEFSDIDYILDETIEHDTYDAVLTTVEYICNLLYDLFKVQNVYQEFNSMFEMEYVGYRFVNHQITKITNNIEINEIEATQLNSTNEVKNLIDKALRHLSDRNKPDYENCIKDCMTAVETMCTQITGKTNSTLGNLLKELEKQDIQVNSYFIKIFHILYGYSCNAKGSRHCGDINGPDVTFEDAKFVLVTSCAFVNYLNGVIKD